tara:strand:- start:7957 stop:8136 length:180 start_codon:yes stop_codon:yes gene_type:complete
MPREVVDAPSTRWNNIVSDYPDHCWIELTSTLMFLESLYVNSGILTRFLLKNMTTLSIE